MPLRCSILAIRMPVDEIVDMSMACSEICEE